MKCLLLAYWQENKACLNTLMRARSYHKGWAAVTVCAKPAPQSGACLPRAPPWQRNLSSSSCRSGRSLLSGSGTCPALGPSDLLMPRENLRWGGFWCRSRYKVLQGRESREPLGACAQISSFDLSGRWDRIYCNTFIWNAALHRDT